MSLLQLVLAILFPPISVFLQTGFGVQLLINVLLTLIGWLPGVIHALWVGFSGTRPVHA
ncbi:MAG: YqaE/Pmp3 family membrane protein [Thermoanaerobaculia bacterium]